MATVTPFSQAAVAASHSGIVDVYLTVDTEFWPRRKYVSPDDYRPDFERDMHGRTSEGDFGIAYQLKLLNEYGHKAVFFIEPLCAFAVGNEPLVETVHLVQSAGHDAQLHMHPEWLKYMPDPLLPEKCGQHMWQFTEDEQALLLAKGLEKITECGARNVCAFRAGNYGANFDTLRALARNGITYDTSHNTAYFDSVCHMQTDQFVLQPAEMYGVREFPIGFVRDFRGRDRVLQLTACSIGELQGALWQAQARGWSSIVIVSHSFELIRGRSKPNDRPRPDWCVIKRFQWLCEFIAKHSDKFRMNTFSNKPALPSSVDGEQVPLRARTRDTLVRFAEQARRRFT